MEVTLQPGKELYAGFWRRVAAYIIDRILLFSGFVLVWFVILMVLEIFFDFKQITNILYLYLNLELVVSVLYYGFFESSNKKATLGKQVMKIIVVDQDFRKLSFWRALSRGLVLLVPYFVFARLSDDVSLWIHAVFLGIWLVIILPIIWTEKSQGLHDILTSSLVVNKNLAWTYIKD